MKLFVRIFLSFWVATVLMIAFVLAISEFFPLTVFGTNDKARFKPEEIVLSVRKLADAFEQEGPSRLDLELKNLDALREKPLVLFDDQGNILLQEGAPPPLYRELASEVLQSGHIELRLFGRRRLFLFPIHSSSGRLYAGVVTLVEPLGRLLSWRFWLRLTVATFPAALVCLLLSLYLTRPITRLRAAAQRLAAGDLSARADSPRVSRTDELGDLARDFDVMACQIEALMTAQRRFVADVSHELGGPLTRVHLALALLRRRFAGENLGELDRLERETSRLSTLVQQLLLLARLEAGSVPAETLSPISVGQLCDHVIDDAGFEALHRGCAVKGSRDDVTLMAYPQLLRRAIDNVLRNAIRYAPPHTEVILDCRIDRDRQQAVLEILDCGPGVPESMLTEIFRPFFRAAPGREDTGGGTGLGLSIAREAIRLHEGTITAKNRERGGLQVTIMMPLRLPIPSDEPRLSSEPSRV